VSHFSFTPVQNELSSDIYLLSFLASSIIKLVIFCMNKMQQKEMVLYCVVFSLFYSSLHHTAPNQKQYLSKDFDIKQLKSHRMIIQRRKTPFYIRLVK